MNQTRSHGRKSDSNSLRAFAASQRGFFRTADARRFGFSTKLLSELTHRGKLERRSRGLYRFPYSAADPHDDIVETWLRLGDGAIASHETALVLNNLTDLMPRSQHFTVPRNLRGRVVPGVKLHTYLQSKQIPHSAYQITDGVPAMKPEVAIVQSVVEGTDPNQIEVALSQLKERGMLHYDSLLKWLESDFLSIPKRSQETLRNFIISHRSASTETELRNAVGLLLNFYRDKLPS
jgi:predicted transcriptional regulator of viral defense system